MTMMPEISGAWRRRSAIWEKKPVTSEPEEILAADRVILPGVGAFGDAMKRLHAMGLVEVIRQAADRGTPFLGICLGLQLLFEKSEESPGVQVWVFCREKSSGCRSFPA